MDKNTSVTQKLVLSWLRFVNKNTLSQAKKNISAHYDLGNDFFRLFLDPTMMYSSAIFSSNEDTLHKASLNKLETVCQKLQLKPTDHLLEIGTGWGGMAIYAAKHYGCRVTTTTISPSQYEYACHRVIEEGLQDKVTVLLQDYRTLQGSYNKLVSIEMIEAVGHDYYPLYFSNCSRLLTEEGIAVIQAITIPDQRYDAARRSVDFIQKYIFPGGSLPSNQVISHQVACNTNMQISDMHDITYDYAMTLQHWRKNFEQTIAQVKQQGFDEQFIRMWQFYFCYCEGGFRERIINTFQYVLVKPQANYKPVSR
jgi:cyclopropane-fatty-acyl-phospholipid synthase